MLIAMFTKTIPHDTAQTILTTMMLGVAFVMAGILGYRHLNTTF